MSTKRPKVNPGKKVSKKVTASPQLLLPLNKKLNFSDSYVSLGLGILVVLILALLILLFAKGRHLKGSGVLNSLGVTIPISTQQADRFQNNNKEDSYTVEEGDDLSSISIKIFGSEDKWGEIANANAIDNPDAIEVGQILKIPR